MILISPKRKKRFVAYPKIYEGSPWEKIEN
jgi:hypothetical protein